MASQIQWFSSTSSIRTAVDLINEIDETKLLRLLGRIITSVHSKNERAFSEEEESKLQSAFGFSAKQMECVLDTISFIIEQAAYHLAKPTLLTQQLKIISLNEAKVECFVKVWQDQGSKIVEVFRKRSLAPKQLDTINWELRLQTAQSNQTKMKIPTTIFELGLTGTENKERLQMEFNHDELYALFQQMEKIQLSLDALNK